MTYANPALCTGKRRACKITSLHAPKQRWWDARMHSPGIDQEMTPPVDLHADVSRQPPFAPTVSPHPPVANTGFRFIAPFSRLAMELACFIGGKLAGCIAKHDRAGSLIIQVFQFILNHEQTSSYSSNLQIIEEKIYKQNKIKNYIKYHYYFFCIHHRLKMIKENL